MKKLGTATRESFVVNVVPMGKPRQTRRDVWKKRGCVLRYRAFADELREACGITAKLERAPLAVNWFAYLPMPASWSKRKQQEMAGTPHRQKPDRDNIDKAVLDALFLEDSAVAMGRINKFWDDGRGPRIELEVIWEAA